VSKKVEVTIPVPSGVSGDGLYFPEEVLRKAIKEASLPMAVTDHRNRKVAEVTKLEGDPGDLRAEMKVLTRPEDPEDLMRLIKCGKVGVTMSSTLDRNTGKMTVDSFSFVAEKKRAVHIIRDIMASSVKKLAAIDFEEATAKVHRETRQYPANAIVINPKALERLVGAEAMRPVDESQKAIFDVTIPDATCVGILEHRHFVFTSSHVPPTKALVFNTGWEAEGHLPKEGSKVVYCIVESGEKGMFC
jgi:hypothetical protein